MLQEVQEAVNTSQAWIYLSRGESKDTPDCMLSWDAVQPAVWNAVAASQDLPPGECPSMSVMQQRNYILGRTGEMEILPFSVGVQGMPGSRGNKKSACHTSPCRKSSMLREGRQGAHSQ